MTSHDKTYQVGDKIYREVGRPTLFDDSMCEQLINHFSEGYSYDSFAGKLGVSISTLYLWEKKHPVFFHAKEIGQAKSRYFWETHILKSQFIANDAEYKPNNTMIIYASKCIAKMTDNHVVTVKHTLDDDQVVKDETLLKSLLKSF